MVFIMVQHVVVVYLPACRVNLFSGSSLDRKWTLLKNSNNNLQRNPKGQLDFVKRITTRRQNSCPDTWPSTAQEAGRGPMVYSKIWLAGHYVQHLRVCEVFLHNAILDNSWSSSVPTQREKRNSSLNRGPNK